MNIYISQSLFVGGDQFQCNLSGKDGPLKERDGVYEKIISFLIVDSHIKDEKIRQLLEKLKYDNNTSITERKHEAENIRICISRKPVNCFKLVYEDG